MKNDAAAEPREIMTLGDVAEYLMCHPSTIYRLIKGGKIPVFRVGSDWRFRRTDIYRWIEGREVRLTAAAASKTGRPGRRKK